MCRRFFYSQQENAARLLVTLELSGHNRSQHRIRSLVRQLRSSYLRSYCGWPDEPSDVQTGRASCSRPLLRSKRVHSKRVLRSKRVLGHSMGLVLQQEHSMEQEPHRSKLVPHRSKLVPHRSKQVLERSSDG